MIRFRYRTARQIITLKDAAYVFRRPEQNLEPWQTAINCLLGAAEAGDFLMHARIGMLRALNGNAEWVNRVRPMREQARTLKFRSRTR